MVRTRVGYAGGITSDPTYHRIGDHSEVVEIDYDPSEIGYEELLDIFWLSHDARQPAASRQYRSAILYRSDAERMAAEASKARLEEGTDPVTTDIERLERFYRAEDYHQKYRLRARPDLMRALVELAGDDRAMVDSTAAARVNGWLGGYGESADVAEWLPTALLAERSTK